MTTEPKPLMTDRDLDKLRALAYEALGDMLTPAGVRCLGFNAIEAADTIAALTAELQRVADALTGEADGPVEPTAESILGALATERQVRDDALGHMRAAVDGYRPKAQQWDAAQAAGALDVNELVTKFWLTRGTTEEAMAAIVAHVRAHDAAAVEAQLDAHAKECERQRGQEQISILALFGHVPDAFDDGEPEETDAFVSRVRRALARAIDLGRNPFDDAPRPAAASEPEGDAIADWLALSEDEQAAPRFARMGARAFTALVAEVRSLRAGRECGGEK